MKPALLERYLIDYSYASYSADKVVGKAVILKNIDQIKAEKNPTEKRLTLVFNLYDIIKNKAF